VLLCKCPLQIVLQFFYCNRTERGAVFVLVSHKTWALTIKNGHILGTLLTYGVIVATQFMTVPTVALEFTKSELVEQSRTSVLAYTVQTQPLDTYPSVEQTVRAYFSDIPVMAKVAWCESHFRHINPYTGVVLTGVVNSSDIGVMQINKVYHEETAQRIGLNIYTLEGNLAYARYLYEREGTRPWSASQHCWNSEGLAMR
jgi:hypothetical protein